jgi:hypothetical protein
MAFRPGLLRAVRSLRDLCTPSVGAPVGRDEILPTIGRPGEARYTPFEVGFIMEIMPFPIKVCAICSEEFELKPDKPGFANRCPECSTEDSVDPVTKRHMDADERKNESEANAARRQAMRELLYRKES